MDVFNLFREHEWAAENDRDGFRHLRTAIGDRLSARMLGASLYKLPPGERTWPYHYEEGCEEWLIVVSGRPNLRGREGERQLNVGDVAVFPEGPEGAHQVINRSDQPCILLILSTRAPIAIVHYPDSGKVGFWSRAAGRQKLLSNGPELDYWEGER